MNKTITITRDEFKGAVMKALDQFVEMGTKGEKGDDPMAILALGMTGTIFGTMIEKTLFGPNEGEEVEADAGNQ